MLFMNEHGLCLVWDEFPSDYQKSLQYACTLMSVFDQVKLILVSC